MQTSAAHLEGVQRFSRTYHKELPMPRYDFSCAVCGAKFERQASYHSGLDGVTCPNGHSQVRRLYSAPSVVFKGNGWYVTDHRRGTGKAAQTEAG